MMINTSVKIKYILFILVVLTALVTGTIACTKPMKLPKKLQNNAETVNAYENNNSQLIRFIYDDKGEEIREYYQVKEKNKRKGLFTRDGKNVLPYEFQRFMSHYNILSAQKSDGKWLLFDYAGKRISLDEWDGIMRTTSPLQNDENGLVRVMKDGLWGCVDQQGKVVIIPNWNEIYLNYYEEIEPYIKVMKDNKYGYLTYNGKLVLKPEWDIVFIDVLNGKPDEIYVRRNNDWGTAKVVNNIARPVDWTKKPSEEIQFGHMDERYTLQAQTMHDLLRTYNDEFMNIISARYFFYDYYRKNSTELLNMPEFRNDKKLDWDGLTRFVYTKADYGKISKQGEPFSLSKDEFDTIAGKYFEGINYTHKSSKWLTYKDNKYSSVGWSDDGYRYYYLDKIEKIPTGDNNYKFKALFLGFQFGEDDFSEEAKSLSLNMKALKVQAKKSKNSGKTQKQVLDEIMVNNPVEVFTPCTEYTIEFTIQNPKADVWLKYLSSSSKEIKQ